MTDIKRYTVKDVAAIYSVKAKTVRSWISKGMLKADKPTGKNYFITPQSLKEFENSR